MAYAHLRTGETRAISRRREQEDARLVMSAAVNANTQLQQLASWEQSTNKIISSNTTKSLARTLAIRDENALKARREKLMELLTEDDRIYRQELANLEETSAQRAKRLVVHARQLKHDREIRRKQFAAEQYERQWKLSCDDLRTIDSEYFKLHCHEEVKRQILDKKHRNLKLTEEEEKWARQWEQERLNRVRIEEEKSKNRQEAINENRLALKQQVYDSNRAHQLENERIQKEKEDFNKLLASEANALKHRQIQELERKRQLQKDIVSYNERLEKERQEQREAQRAQERREVEVKLEEFRIDNAAKAEMQAAQRRDMNEYREYLQAKREEERRMEAMMDAMIASEVSRENDRRDMQWAKEQLARDKLMKSVYETREQQLQEKAMAQRRYEEEMLLEKRAHELELARVADDEEQAKVLEKEAQMMRRRELEAQMDAIAMRKQLEEQRIIRDKQAALQQEAEYRQQLQRAKRQTADLAKINYGLKQHFGNRP